MNLEEFLDEAIAQSDSANLAMAAKYSGTDEPHKVDWASGGRGETDLGKRAMKKKRKRRLASYTSKMN